MKHRNEYNFYKDCPQLLIWGVHFLKIFSKMFILILIFISITIIFAGCGDKEVRDFTKAQKMIANLNSYTTVAEIVVKGNKLIESYVVKQYFVYPNKYRLEVISPDERKGKITIYDGERLFINHPLIKQTTILNIKEVEDMGMFLGNFAKNLFSGEDVNLEIKKDESFEYVVIKACIVGGNKYRKNQTLYIDRKDNIPVKMEITDENDDVVVTVYYKDFEYNVDIENTMFKIEDIKP